MTSTTPPAGDLWPSIISTLLRRAATDAVFRQVCLRDPRGALKEIAGTDVPAAVKVRFVEPGDDTVIVLPKFCAAQGDISDADLEGASGGAANISARCGVGTGGCAMI